MTEARPVLRSYLPGEWYVVLAADLVLALPPDQRDLASSVWTVVDAGADADAVLDLVLGSGLSGLTGFALVSTEATRTRAIARGPVACRLEAADGDIAVDGAETTTWVEGSLDDTASATVQLGSAVRPDPATDPAGLRVADGLVRASGIAWTLLPPHHGAGAEPPEKALTEKALTEKALSETAPAETAPAETAPAETAPPETAPPEPPETAPAVVSAPPVVAPSPVPRPDQAQGLAAQPNSQPQARWDPASGDHDGRTQDGSWGAEEFRRPRPGIPGQPPAPAVISSPEAVLRFSHGERVDVDRVVIIGRAPEARRFTATEQPRLVAVPSPQQEISSTHLEVRPGTGADHGSAVATDLGSTNGTVLAQPGLPAESLRPGIPVQLIPGAVLDLGDGVSITVTRP